MGGLGIAAIGARQTFAERLRRRWAAFNAWLQSCHDFDCPAVHSDDERCGRRHVCTLCRANDEMIGL